MVLRDFEKISLIGCTKICEFLQLLKWYITNSQSMDPDEPKVRLPVVNGFVSTGDEIYVESSCSCSSSNGFVCVCPGRGANNDMLERCGSYELSRHC